MTTYSSSVKIIEKLLDKCEFVKLVRKLILLIKGTPNWGVTYLELDKYLKAESITVDLSIYNSGGELFFNNKIPYTVCEQITQSFNTDPDVNYAITWIWGNRPANYNFLPNDLRSYAKSGFGFAAIKGLQCASYSDAKNHSGIADEIFTIRIKQIPLPHKDYCD